MGQKMAKCAKGLVSCAKFTCCCGWYAWSTTKVRNKMIEKCDFYNRYPEQADNEDAFKALGIGELEINKLYNTFNLVSAVAVDLLLQIQF